MAETVAYRILSAIKSRLDGISVFNGYNTDPARVVLGVENANPDDVEAGPVISVYELRDTPTGESNIGQDQEIQLDIAIEVVMQYAGDNKALSLSRAWQDIMRAVFTADSTLGGLAMETARGGRAFSYPEPGGDLVGVQQTVVVSYFEPYGNP